MGFVGNFDRLRDVSLPSRVLAALLKAPPALTRDLVVKQDLRVRAPDGIELLTDLYLTPASEPQPTVLIRSPYGRRGIHGIMARLFAERGYHVVCQSARGTAGSGGEIDPGQEAGDGRATADWIVDQEWSNGEIGGFGASYLSYAQWALASTRPPQLKAMAIQVYSAERRAPNYPGGAFALDRGLTWTYLVSNEGNSRLGARGAGRALKPAFGHLPLGTADTVAVGRPVSYFRDWLEHDAPGDPYWTPTDFRPILRDLGIPVSMVAGWYDVFLPYMIEDYEALRKSGQDVRLRVGGWPHSSLGLAGFALRDALDLFDVHLRHRPPQPSPAVQVEVMGGAGWRDLEEWPPSASVQRWHLQPDHALSPTLPPSSEPDRYRYDPADPTPSVGGSSLSMNSGAKDNRALEKRPDVLTYTSPPLDADLEIIGPVSAELHVSSSLTHTDFFARLCDVDGKGRSANITDGLVRLTSDDPGQIRVELWPTAHRFRAGHRIRLQVSSGAHPRYARNLGTGEPLATGTAMQAADQAVHHEPERPSAVLLPVVNAPQAEPDTAQPGG
jgi:putative CocE/NonD family hydrolase